MISNPNRQDPAVSALREADIRPASVHNEYLRLSAEDSRHFFPDADAFTPRLCPGCGDNQAVPAFAKHGFSLVTCQTCGTLYVNPVPPDDRLARFYQDSPSASYWANVFFPTVAEARRPRIFRPRAERVKALSGKYGVTPQHIVDVGAGAAIFLEELTKLLPTSELGAIEPGKALAQTCRDKGFSTFEDFVEQAPASWQNHADIVTSFEVIEHVTSPVAFLSALGALARAGGLVIVTGLCGDGFDIKTLGSRSKAIAPPHHLNFLSRDGVASLIRRAGLELLDFLTPGELDVDIVLNAVKEDPDAVGDAVLHRRLTNSTDEERAQWQAQLVAEKHSSHMWIVARRP